MNAARLSADDKLHCSRPNGGRCPPECGIGMYHALRCPVVPRAPLAELDALHELAWAIVLAGQSDRGELQPPALGDLTRRGLADRAIALIGEVGDA